MLLSNEKQTKNCLCKYLCQRFMTIKFRCNRKSATKFLLVERQKSFVGVFVTLGLLGLWKNPSLSKNTRNGSASGESAKRGGALCGGRIAFQSSRDCKDANDINREIYIMESDGSHQSRLTFQPRWDGNPHFGFGGRTILFDSIGSDLKRNLYLMAADGTGLKRLTRSSAVDVEPAISPDGRSIVWSSDGARAGGFRIYRMRRDGSEVRQLTQYYGEYPSFSPDGRHIAFGAFAPSVGSRTGYGGYLTGMLYTMNVDGSGKTALRTGMKPRYSPDGKQLVFYLPSMTDSRIGVTDDKGKTVRWLSPRHVSDENPAWSPDGQWIVFDSDPARRNHRPTQFSSRRQNRRSREIYVMRRDGSSVMRLTHTLNGTNLSPSWTRIDGKN